MEATGLEQLAAEALPLVGAGRALLLQIAHPAVGRAVAEHSDFANRAMDRLHSTMTFVYASVFASPEEFAVVRRAVNRAHAPVRAQAAENEPAYSAFDPGLQLWVAATLYRTMVELYERVFGPLSAAYAEEVYRAFTRTGLSLQVPPEQWPPTRKAFDEYWDRMVAQLRVTDATRAVSRQILYPRAVPLWLRAFLPDVRLVTAGLLPASIRQQFGLPWDERRRRRFERWMRRLAAVYPHVPLRLRHAPRDVYLRRLRRSMPREAARPAATAEQPVETRD